MQVMTTLDRLIDARRSVRKYTDTPPPEECLLKMISAAIKAPSPSNRQPVRFIRVISSGAKAALREAMLLGRERLLTTVTDSDSPKKLRNRVNVSYRFSEFMFDAPALFAVGTTMEVPSLTESLPDPGYCGRRDERHRDLDISVGLALMGYLLKGEELGLGSCILTAPLIFIDEPEKSLSLDGTSVRCFITTGYPAEKPAFISRKELAEIYREV
ncbi:MAG: nitroreductase family protein [Syntrophales bacterium]|nr:nitroreductase family protein [Syntrophales bacterium]